ncbi:helix-turn-helix domain-containing protein, partial [bacterium]|nr:helix-turn-helix domain-containing protein [bacterium]
MVEKQRKYKLISEIDRERIWELKLRGKKGRAIAKELGFSHTTISRELKKNSFREMPEAYSPVIARNLAQERRSRRGRKKQILHPQILDYVRVKLEEGWSPQLIAGRISKDHPGLSVSHETVYQYVFENQLHHLLPSQR